MQGERCFIPKKERAAMEENNPSYVTKKQIGSTVYTVRPIFQEGCTETATAKMVRLMEHETRLNPYPQTSEICRKMV